MSRSLLLPLLLGLLAMHAALAQSPEPTPRRRFDVRADVAPATTPTRFAVEQSVVAPSHFPPSPRFSLTGVASTKGIADCAADDGTIFRNGFED